MAKLMRLGSSLWRRGNELLTGEDCCDCGSGACSAKYIPCCMEEMQFQLLCTRVDSDVDPDDRATFIQKRVLVKWYEHASADPVISEDARVGFLIQGSQGLLHKSGWGIWGLGAKSDILKSFYSGSVGHYPIKVECQFRNVKGSAGKLRVEPEDLDIFVKNWGSALALPFEGFEDPFSKFTITGDQAETTNDVDMCDDVTIVLLYGQLSTVDDVLVRNKDFCSTPEMKENLPVVDLRCLQRLEILSPDTYSPLDAMEIGSCEADPDCDCDCWLDENPCTCLNNLQAWNTLSQGERFREYVGAANTVQFQVYSFDYTKDEVFSVGLNECYDLNGNIIVQRSFEINRGMTFQSVSATVFYETSIPGLVNAEFLVLTFNVDVPAIDKDTVWFSEGYNNIRLHIDEVTNIITLTVNGATTSADLSSNTIFQGFVTSDYVVFGGDPADATSSGDERTEGCFRDISVS